MEINKEHIDELIAKYLSGEALPEDAVLLDDWKQSSPDHLHYFNECRKAFVLINSPEGEKKIDTNRMYQNILLQIDTPQQRPPRVYSLKNYATPLNMAAAVLLFSLMGVFAAYFLNDHAREDIVIASSGKSQQKHLADGSLVFLNKHAKLAIADDFNKKERKVKLQGEAFFEVVHHDEKPFIIDAGGVQVKDIGTSFNVKAEPQSDSVTVFVVTGIVDMISSNKTLRLSQNQTAVYIRSLNELREIKTENTNITSYKTKIFHFKAATLEEVLTSLNEVYGMQIILENKNIANCRITVDFNNELPETMVTIITETLGLTFQKTNTGFEIKGKSCIQ